MPARPAAAAFDMIQTVFRLDPLRERLTARGLPASALELWLARTLRDGFALAASGFYRPFRETAKGTLEGLFLEHGQPADPSHVSEVLDGFAELPAHPDAAPAMTRLRDAGVRVLAVTNGGRSNTEALLKKSGLGKFVERVVSIDDAKAWKPRAEVYQYAAETAGVEPGRLALVAAHAWDCHGATRAGLVSGWVSRTEKLFNPVFGRPDVEGPDLPAVCDALLKLPSE